ncbi:hypothetical protein CY34DRAFT_674029 [Suillus luteus UH-Slu-Lm8-n1]|uniref:Uncharacterized protein n=1 Tax=Suillus luteus UH-Slu-Lm8-n1 TaxID=930992 RepID=A0A0D0AQB0_9AGAM|nr:hypothetical protein CY34DRAFT_674029 [Suillus luteus UH-Slu-Lm8-n1]
MRRRGARHRNITSYNWRQMSKTGNSSPRRTPWSTCTGIGRGFRTSTQNSRETNADLSSCIFYLPIERPGRQCALGLMLSAHFNLTTCVLPADVSSACRVDLHQVLAFSRDDHTIPSMWSHAKAGGRTR